MKTAEEKRWELMQQVLLAENRGDEPRSFSSGRTLFGIKSHVEEVMERVAAEDEARCLAVMREGDIRRDGQSEETSGDTAERQRDASGA